jgi:hypothetical protein
MTDREMLELAAKAAGLRLTWGEKYRVGDDEVDCTDLPYVVSDCHDEAPVYWNPLTDDGDALRLAVKLRLVVGSDGQSCKPRVEVWRRHYPTPRVMEFEDSDPYAATRLAITRAAAEIGRQMP